MLILITFLEIFIEGFPRQVGMESTPVCGSPVHWGKHDNVDFGNTTSNLDGDTLREHNAKEHRLCS